MFSWQRHGSMPLDRHTTGPVINQTWSTRADRSGSRTITYCRKLLFHPQGGTTSVPPCCKRFARRTPNSGYSFIAASTLANKVGLSARAFSCTLVILVPVFSRSILLLSLFASRCGRLGYTASLADAVSEHVGAGLHTQARAEI